MRSGGSNSLIPSNDESLVTSASRGGWKHFLQQHISYTGVNQSLVEAV